MLIHDQMIHNRIIMNFHHEYPVIKVLDAVGAMIDNGQNGTDVVIIDGYDFNRGAIKDIDQIKKFAKEKSVEVWFSDTIYPNSLDEDGIPKNLNPFIHDIKTVLTIKPDGNSLKLSFVKHGAISQESHLCLDAKTLLIC
ncbi:hypothetical protein EW093_08355 [Thiospirochaeta perfilievii]|uniref:Uncharacterized protein n=1 Tax=Thiospirochaeta perfilievii TaxID=252967 RepID=A0A5C1QBF8_9SPIO|nr:hypothetical protein [Thiospirochaeta perfilievii]QEN04718.1 hypothetical protein EW093_08355 [Thiospirochaeta perfilievii]